MRKAALAVLLLVVFISVAAQAQEVTLSVTIAGPTRVPPGVEHVLTYTVRNIGAATVTNTTLDAYRFPYPPFAFAVFDPPCTRTVNPIGTPIYRCTIATLEPGQTTTFTARWEPGTVPVTEYNAAVIGSFSEHFIITGESDVPALSPAMLALLAAAMAIAAMFVLRR